MNKIGFLIYLNDNIDNVKQIIDTLKDYKVIVLNDKNNEHLNTHTRLYRGGKKHYAACVNDGLREMSKEEYNHIFIIRDSTIITDTNFIEPYINCSQKTGNNILFNNDRCNYEFDYNGVILQISERFYKHFIYLNKTCIKQIGYLDERYEDTFDILDYYYRLYNKGLTGPIGYFPSPKYKLFDTGFSVDKDFKDENMLLRGLKLFRTKFGFTPVDTPLFNITETSEKYQKIFKNYAK